MEFQINSVVNSLKCPKSKSLSHYLTELTCVTLKKIPTIVFVIVPLLYKISHMLISYCKFIMPKALKWGILHICTFNFHQDIPKNAWKYLKIFFMNSPGFVNFSKTCFQAFFWVSNCKIKVQQLNKPHFKAFGMMNLQN